jgi:hypothetical protein
MNKGDILLLEVRLSNGNNNVISESVAKKMVLFNLTPLEILGVNCDWRKISIADSISISQISGTKSITLIYKDLVYEDKIEEEVLIRDEVILSQVNYFKEDHLQTSLEGYFNIKAFFNNEGLGFYVLEKK